MLYFAAQPNNLCRTTQPNNCVKRKLFGCAVKKIWCCVNLEDVVRQFGGNVSTRLRCASHNARALRQRRGPDLNHGHQVRSLQTFILKSI